MRALAICALLLLAGCETSGKYAGLQVVIPDYIEPTTPTIRYICELPAAFEIPIYRNTVVKTFTLPRSKIERMCGADTLACVFDFGFRDGAYHYTRYIAGGTDIHSACHEDMHTLGMQHNEL